VGLEDRVLGESVSLLNGSLGEIGGDVLLRAFDPTLDKFINDEESIKGQELDEENLLLSGASLPDELELSSGVSKSIYAVDTSSIVLGECGKGVVFAVRGVTVRWNVACMEGSIVQRFEAPCFVSNGNKKQLYNGLRKKLLGLSKVRQAPDLLKMVDRVRNVYERYMQRQAAEKCKDSILLFDGSLTGDTIDTPAQVLTDTLQAASANNSDVIAFSKKTRLVTKRGDKILDLLSGKRDFPVIVPVKNLIETGEKHRLLGEVYIAKLSAVPLSFRVDVHSKRDHSQVFSDMLRSLYLENGYPKPLIQAHVFCYFNSFDALSYQALLARSGVFVRQDLDVRKILFGSYGGM
jgi:hypothetical protein